jgi:hypothetical protein
MFRSHSNVPMTGLNPNRPTLAQDHRPEPVRSLPRRGGLGRIRGLGLALAFAIAAVAATSGSAAAYSVSGPSGYSCQNAKISVSPPRYWATDATETVVWANLVQRWDSRAGTWYNYATYYNWASFNKFGQSVTSWSAMTTTTGGMYHNSTLNLPVSYQGYYRVFAVVFTAVDGIARWSNFVGGAGAYCWMP